MYYSSFGLLSVILHLIINHDVMKNARKDRSRGPGFRYKQFLDCLLVFYIADFSWGFLQETGIRVIAYADTVLFFAMMALSVMLWTRYVVAFLNKKGVKSNALIAAGWAFFGLVILALIVNFFVPVVFEFKEGTEYVPCVGRYALLTVQIMLFIVLSVYSLIVSRRFRGRNKAHHIAVCACGVVMALFIVFQILFPFAPFYTVGCLIANCLIHVTVEADEKRDQIKLAAVAQKEKEIARRDELTGTKNKTAYTEFEQSIQKKIDKGSSVAPFALVVCDLNGLKKINDTKGHLAGDEYIIDSAKALCDTFQHSPVFRIGGDEFAVYLSGNDYNSRQDLLESIYEFSLTNRDRQEGPVIAIGMSDYDPDSDQSFDDVFVRADSLMYENKRKLKRTQS